MQCYQHQDRAAIGVCKACQKAVCSTCGQDTGRGLACSEACVNEVKVINEIIDRSKRSTALGVNRNSLPPEYFSMLFLH